jgi:hypothetical protein
MQISPPGGGGGKGGGRGGRGYKKLQCTQVVLRKDSEKGETRHDLELFPEPVETRVGGQMKL